jgi:hypothetical protein
MRFAMRSGVLGLDHHQHSVGEVRGVEKEEEGGMQIVSCETRKHEG